jgi:hypothetical protein
MPADAAMRSIAFAAAGEAIGSAGVANAGEC